MAKRNTEQIGYSGVLNPAAVIMVCAVVLTILGVTILLSASLPINDNAPYYIIKNQAVAIVMTIFVGLVVLKINLEWARKFIGVGYAICILALVAVLIPSIGHLVNGSRSWIRFGSVGFQVAEFSRIGIVFFVADYFSSIREDNTTFLKGFIYPCVGIGLFIGLVILQPDLGTAFTLSVAAICLLYLAGVKLLYLVPSVVISFGGIVALVYHDAERWSRLTSYLNMEEEKADNAYQVWQAILAFGAGGVDGVGLGNGRQQLNFLPEAHTDFILAIIGEELGLVATFTVLVVFAIMFIAGFIHVRKAPNTYQYLLAAGCVLMIAVQALTNLGVVTGALPTTGLPLPFISFGRTNFLVMGIFVAILLNTSIAWRNPVLNQSKRKLKEID